VEYQVDEALPVLRRTPAVLRALLLDLPSSWIDAVERPGTWSPYDVVGHLIHGERTDWIPRLEHMLRHGDAVPFPPFDRAAMFASSRGRSLRELLDTFDHLRARNVDRLIELRLTHEDFERRAGISALARSSSSSPASARSSLPPDEAGS
jgi:hypothetical protein